MISPRSRTRYNQPIPHMRARTSSGMRQGWLTLFFLVASLPPLASASSLGDTARELAHKISAASGPGGFALQVTNHSSLDGKSLREVRGALEAELRVEGVHTSNPEQAAGTIEVVLSESLRDYVWTAEITIGSDGKKVAMVSTPRPPTGTPFSAALPMTLKATLLLSQQPPILDVALIEMPGASRLIVLESDAVAIYHRQSAAFSGQWELESTLPIVHSHTFPRDLRGRLLLRRDHLFDVYLPGTFCRTNSSTGAAITLSCGETDDPWPLTPDDGSVRAFYAAKRNFFAGTLSPGIGKVANVPAFYSSAALPHSNYTLWAFAAVDGSLHLLDGFTDQLVRGVRWGSDLAAVRSNCGTGAQLLVSESGEAERDGLRAFEIPDRDPIAASSAMEFDGQIVALWPESTGNGAVAVIKRKDTGWYEAYRVSVSCSN
jgi:hypothetical protein